MVFSSLLVLFPLYAIIRQPLKYMMGLNGEQISAVADALNWATISIENGWVKNVAEGAANAFSNTGYNQLFLASLINPENLSAAQAAVGEGAAKMFGDELPVPRPGPLSGAQRQVLGQRHQLGQHRAVPHPCDFRRYGPSVLYHLHADQSDEQPVPECPAKLHQPYDDDHESPDVPVDRFYHACRSGRVLGGEQPAVSAAGVCGG